VVVVVVLVLVLVVVVLLHPCSEEQPADFTHSAYIWGCCAN